MRHHSILTLTLLSLRSLLAELKPLELEVLLPSPTCRGLEGRLDRNFCSIDCLAPVGPTSLFTAGGLLTFPGDTSWLGSFLGELPATERYETVARSGQIS